MQAQMHNYNSWVTETDTQLIAIHYRVKLESAGFTILKEIDYFFTPQGYTCLFLLSESHFAIHTFPEEGKSYIELSSCVKKPFDKFIKSV